MKCFVNYYVSIFKSCQMSKIKDAVQKSATQQTYHEHMSERVSHSSVNVCH